MALRSRRACGRAPPGPGLRRAGAVGRAAVPASGAPARAWSNAVAPRCGCTARRRGRWWSSPTTPSSTATSPHRPRPRVNALVVNLIEHKFADRAPRIRIAPATRRSPRRATSRRPARRTSRTSDRVLARAAAAGMVVLLAPALPRRPRRRRGLVRRDPPERPGQAARLRRYPSARATGARRIWCGSRGGDAPPMAAGDEIEALVAGIRDADRGPPSRRAQRALPLGARRLRRPWLDLKHHVLRLRGHGRQLWRDAHRRRDVPTMSSRAPTRARGEPGLHRSRRPIARCCPAPPATCSANKPIWLFGPGLARGARLTRARERCSTLAELIAAHDLRGLTPPAYFPGAPAGDGLASARARSGAVLSARRRRPARAGAAAASGAAPCSVVRSGDRSHHRGRPGRRRRRRSR